LHERLVVEDDVVDLVQRGARLLEAVGQRLRREARVVLAPREALFLRGGDDAAVLDQRGGAVVVVGRDAEDAGHRRRSRGDAPGRALPATGGPAQAPAATARSWS